MIRSMFTAISSLNLHQTYLDVIADNLANTNTTGYKSSRVVFQDQFAQIMSSGSAPSGTSGGINPTQVGLGVKLGYVSPVFTQGMLQSTGRSTDLAIQGDGFFIYAAGDEQRFSREGSLEIDATGFLVNNSTGMRIQGWTVPAEWFDSGYEPTCWRYAGSPRSNPGPGNPKRSIWRQSEFHHPGGSSSRQYT